MNIPQFPAHDLAKLVLGYLAEEQLMTAYDEFLSASPYLDAMRNEYDRIFMTSLKNILAEYRAVKIYVETCKPLVLRRRLFGCTNLLEVVKFLVQNVDINKIKCSDGNRSSFADKSTACAVCSSLKLSSCVCKSRHSLQARNSNSNVAEGSSPESSVETTCLEDLPGNHVTVRKKHIKTLPKDSRVCHDLNAGSNSDSSLNADRTTANQFHNPVNSTLANVDTLQPNQRVDQTTSGNSSQVITRDVSSNDASDRMSIDGTFQNFSSGVKGGENVNSIVPDSSTSENTNTQPILSKENCNTGSKEVVLSNSKPVSKAHIVLTVGSTKSTAQLQFNQQPNEAVSESNSRPKVSEQKVTILSDIKVDKTFNSDGNNIPPVLKNATSTPLMQMQTILINGTPAYKPLPPTMGPNRNFTKDEIMAMPTIIVVPTSGTSKIPSCVKPGTQVPAIPPNSSSPSKGSLEPLVVDVPSKSPLRSTGGSMSCIEQQKNVTVPKDNEQSNKNTPKGPLPVRKSSSTPRRSTHIRVLDFTTPRRILQETIVENSGEGEGAPVEVLVSKSPNLHTLADPSCVNNETIEETEKTTKADNNEKNSSGSSKENEKVLRTGKRNWDADLRALAIPNSKEELAKVPESRINPGCRRTPKNCVKKSKNLEKKNTKHSNNNKSKPTDTKAKTIKKPKEAEMIPDTEEADEDSIIVVDDTPNVPVKPTINIITGPEWNSQEGDKNSSNKSSNGDQTDTPEMDRISLQNIIGAKLNISELLETPYKQALYDIQMETPRFLGPDLPGEPISDIKIMNIPTPRFLNTPKTQSTPYASRPTDYSSGSSYYKPDDQDYMPVDLGHPIPSIKEKELTTSVEVTVVKEKTNKAKITKSSRPVRKCTKNVSYVSSPVIGKQNEVVDHSEDASTCSESTYTRDINVSNVNKGKTKPIKKSKPIKESKPLKESKQNVKRASASRKTKTPVKKDTPKSFMKIKPRRVTPVKERGKGRTKKKEEPIRKRTSSKEKGDEVTPAVVSAPPKSRRKSSTPRKLHCTKTFNSESSGHDSPDSKRKENINEKSQAPYPTDSDSEQIPLCWSDDGSQDTKSKHVQNNTSSVAQESEDITKIKEYIASELRQVENNTKPTDFHEDLVKRGFDTETAKIIERDLLDTSPHPKEKNNVNITAEEPIKKVDPALEKSIESDTSNNLKIVQDENDEEEIEFSTSECFEGSENYISCVHDDQQEVLEKPLVKLKDKFCMEVCIDDGVAIRLRATPLTAMLELDPKDVEPAEYDAKETEIAVSSISNIDKLYTPMKDSLRAQVYDIFESTLTSLDTPLKVSSPKRKECDTTVTEIVLEVEKVEDSSKTQNLNRKRPRSEDSTDSPTSSKKTKADAQSLLSSASNFNFDIESVLYKLHGSEQ